MIILSYQDQCDRSCEFKGDVKKPELLNAYDARQQRTVPQLIVHNVAYCCMLSRFKSLIALDNTKRAR